MKKQISILSLIFLISFSNALALSEEYQIQSKQQAYDVAIQVTGFEQETFPFDSLLENDISLDTIYDDNIPFWVPEESGTLVWVVSFDEYKYRPDRVKKKIYKVYLIAKTKQLMKISGQEDVSKEFFMDKISKESFRIEINCLNSEEWVGFPESNSWLSFFEYIEPNSIPRTSSAKELYAIRVYSTDLNNEPRLVWIIFCNDMPSYRNGNFYWGSSMTHLDGNSGHIISVSGNF